MPGLLITIGVDQASDSWGFVGVVKVGEVEAYRTLEAFPSRAEAEVHTQRLVGGLLGELLAGQEWRHVRDHVEHRGAPTRKDFRLGSLFGGGVVSQPVPSSDAEAE